MSPRQPWTRGFQLTDATDVTPLESPIGSGTTDVELVWPANAAALHVYCSAAALLKDDDGNTFPIPASTVFAVPGKPGDTTIIDRSGGACTVSFAFEKLVVG